MVPRDDFITITIIGKNGSWLRIWETDLGFVRIKRSSLDIQFSRDTEIDYSYDIITSIISSEYANQPVQTHVQAWIATEAANPAS